MSREQKIDRVLAQAAIEAADRRYDGLKADIWLGKSRLRDPRARAAVKVNLEPIASLASPAAVIASRALVALEAYEATELGLPELWGQR